MSYLVLHFSIRCLDNVEHKWLFLVEYDILIKYIEYHIQPFYEDYCLYQLSCVIIYGVDTNYTEFGSYKI